MERRQNKRNPLLNGQIEPPQTEGGDPTPKKDEFLPKYSLEYGLPDIPVKPKLFRHVDNNLEAKDNSLYKYEYSSIEMMQEKHTGPGQTT